MIRWLRAWWDRALTWWLLHGQFWVPMLAVSPTRRAAHCDVMAWCAEPGFTDGQWLLLMHRIWCEENGVDDPLTGLDEAEPVRRISGSGGPTGEHA
ncbi:hypothetical protein [Streptomyces sp. CBMA123]|uniref:hypothetical protein n=1 Tax=Streptomyces sp. CBMA123 TaxID=1896313 RepID=UPI001662124D|nr:hypothetical protein [Streptomyces sp. CBMA123]MBD0691143.1 hypothetical protein [Streptomyces sp. CBMA123]